VRGWTEGNRAATAPVLSLHALGLTDSVGAGYLDMTQEAYRFVVAVNRDAVFFGMQKQLPAIIASGGGAIVNVTSVDADRGHLRCAAYTATKRAVRGLTGVAAIGNARTGVRINELQPGVIATELSKAVPVGTAVAQSKVPTGRTDRHGTHRRKEHQLLPIIHHQ